MDYFIVDMGYRDLKGFDKQEQVFTSDIYDAAKKLVDAHDKGYDAINVYWRGGGKENADV